MKLIRILIRQLTHFDVRADYSLTMIYIYIDELGNCGNKVRWIIVGIL